ncbi:CGNR zinc finger domain-containing protein [Micromonospora sp. NPDC001898]|uniref:CGNR zinc finger domain-containing protein n=1 Tax=Micromonospora sp. NPDC001898 TaxID=3364221 RepID=UPI0036A55E60
MVKAEDVKVREHVSEVPAFRLDNEQLAFRFTATLSDRSGQPVERLPDAGRLDDWLAANRLGLGGERAVGSDLVLARRLREAIHRAGSDVAAGSPARRADVTLINMLARESQSFPVLTEDGMRWQTEAGSQVQASLGLIARDAILALGGEQRDRVKACENSDCGGLYVDTSQARNRRWCSMNTCGNRAKKAKFRHGRTSAGN